MGEGKHKGKREVEAEAGEEAGSPPGGQEAWDHPRPPVRVGRELETVELPRIVSGVVEELDNPAYYINRELSWLEFNRRVFDQTLDETTPLLERLKFLCISSSNLDEFFEVRVARLRHQVWHAESAQAGPDGMTPEEQIAEIGDVVHRFVTEQYRVLNEVLFPALAAEGIRFVRRTEWSAEQAAWVREFFRAEVMPVLSPIGLDPAHPFPRIVNKSLNFIVSLEGQDAFGRATNLAVVQAPRSLPRLIQLPAELAEGQYDFVFLSSIIHAHVNELFAGMQVTGCYQFRVTRNSELFVDEEEVEDLMLALEDELFSRHFADAVRLEVADNCPRRVARFLLDQFKLDERDLYQVNGPVNLYRLMAIPGMIARPDLKYAPFTASSRIPTTHKVDLFAELRQRDMLLHHPFEGFNTVVELVRQAAADPAVLAIKQTVYRTEADSVLVHALIEAAKAGKEVTAIVELRARFDEERNIRLAHELQEAGAHVVYGVVGYKTHAKMLLIVRREHDGLRRYVHLGTGNYHPRTAKLYTDLGLLTSQRKIGEDVQKMFQQLTGLGKVMKLAKTFQSPFTLFPAMLKKIEREAEHARAGRPAHIMAKMNSITEPEIIRALYRASQAGVRIDLIVRGVCRLRPGVPGVSESIHVRSIIGRFLEHSRVYYFKNGGDEEVFCSSADWMSRNLHRRVETCFPVEAPELARRVIRESFEVYLRDNTQAWVLGPDATYEHISPGPGEEPFTAQRVLMRELGD